MMESSDFDKTKDYGDGRTKQSFKDSTDINKMLKKAQTVGSLAHLQKYPAATYGAFDGTFDLLTAHEQIKKADIIFADLPSEIRNEFNNEALKFMRFAGDPENNDKLRELLPELAEPGRMFPNPVNRDDPEPAVAAAIPGDPPPVVVAEVVTDG